MPLLEDKQDQLSSGIVNVFFLIFLQLLSFSLRRKKKKEIVSALGNLLAISLSSREIQAS